MSVKKQNGYLQFLKTISRFKAHGVCARHWPADHQTKKVRRKFCLVDPPSVFECVKFSQGPTAPPPPQLTQKILFASRQMEIDQLNEFDQMDSVNSYKDLIDGLPKRKKKGR